MTSDRSHVVFQLSAHSQPHVAVDRHVVSDMVGHLLAGRRESTANANMDTTFPSASINPVGDPEAPTYEAWPVAAHTPMLQSRNPPGRVEVRVDDNAVVLPATATATIAGLGAFLAGGSGLAERAALQSSVDPIPAVTARGCANGAAAMPGGID